MAKKPIRRPRLAVVKNDPPWDDDDSSSSVVAFDVSAGGLGNGKEPTPFEKLLAATDDPDELARLQGMAAFTRTMNGISKRVDDFDTPYNGTAVKEAAVRAALGSIMRLLPVAEAQYMLTKQDKASYAYANLVQQQMSLIAEMNTMVTTDVQAERIIAEVMRPSFQSVLQFLVAEVSAIKQSLTSATDLSALQRNTNTKLSEMLRNLGTYMQETADKAEADTAGALK